MKDEGFYNTRILPHGRTQGTEGGSCPPADRFFFKKKGQFLRKKIGIFGQKMGFCPPDFFILF